MTMPNERTRAIQNTREFLRDLLDPKKIPRIPREIRRRAYRCLKHYPGDLYLEQASRAVPETFGKPDKD